MNKQAVDEELSQAVEDTHRVFPSFEGVIVFGSFPHKAHPADLDLIPVMNTYGGNWDFSPVSEDDAEDCHPDFQKYLTIRTHLGKHFTHLSQPVFKTRHQEGIVHIEELVALDNLPLLKRSLIRLSADWRTFRGSETGYNILQEYFS